MKKIINLFTDLFENSEVTNNRLAAFGANCYLRLTTNNPGNVFDALLGPTKTAVNDMTKALEEAGADIGNRKGKNLNKKMSDFYTNADALHVTNSGTVVDSIR